LGSLFASRRGGVPVGEAPIDIFLLLTANRSHLLPVIGLVILSSVTPAPAGPAHVDPAVPAVTQTYADEPGSAEPGTSTEDDGEQAVALEERVRVVGSKDHARASTGSEEFLTEEELARHEYTDIQRVLRRVPGVYLQDEEGYGLRPNIGLRGTGVERSQKVTLMEDGVLIAPAPYSAPSAYYFPTAGRMESMEISKGPASIRQGPHTTGGVLNLISRAIPNRFSALGELAFGNDGNARGKFSAGDSAERYGWLVETFQQKTDGFKQLDGGGDTGFDLEDYGAKLRVNSAEGSSFYQSLELKIGSTEQTGDETYLGLTEDDFARDPYRRYAASSEDVIATEHEQVQLRHFAVPNSGLDLTTTAYYNNFFRNWRKLQSVGGEGIGDILAEPAAEEFDGLIDIIRGDADSAPGDLLVRNNRRDYYSRGVQSVLGIRLDSPRTHHAIEIGVRYHEDEEDRFQEEDAFQMVGGSMQLTAPGDAGSQSNRISRAEALALFVRDTIDVGRWRLEPGVRLESVDFTRRDFGDVDPGRAGTDLVVKQNDVDEIIPGVGVIYAADEWISFFGGVHRGFAPPGPGKNDATQPEESVNYELGVRIGHDALHLQAVAFYSDYDNLLGTDTTSGGGTGTGEQFNGGEVEVKGLELSFARDLAAASERKYSIPVQLAYTFTQGEFRSSFETSFADWAPEVTAGDELPYLPEHQLFAEIGWRNAHWSAFVAGSYVDEMRTKAGQGSIPEEESIDEHLVVDASGEYRFRQHYRAFIRVRNLTDEIYVAARRPAGLRPGLARTFMAGFGVSF
jgi:Fe(3+) dicitrate transport protein